MDKSALIIGVGMTLLGSSFFLTSLILALRKKSKIARFNKTTGVIVHVETSLGVSNTSSRSRSTLYKPTVRFQMADGQLIDYTPQTSNSWSNYKVGEQVQVYYDPQRTEKPIFGKNSKLYVGLTVFGAVGFFFAVIGVVFLLFSLF